MRQMYRFIWQKEYTNACLNAGAVDRTGRLQWSRKKHLKEIHKRYFPTDLNKGQIFVNSMHAYLTSKH